MAELMPYLYLGILIKIPVIAMLWLIYWAMKSHDATEDNGGGDREYHWPDHGPHDPKRPRRGPHGPQARPLPECPPGGRTHKPARKPIVLPDHHRGVHQYPFR